MTMQQTSDEYRIRWSTGLLFFAYTLAARLIPYVLHRLGFNIDPEVSYYPWNFTPAFAVCLFTGAFCSSRLVACVLPMATFLVSDLGIWALTGRLDWAFYPAQSAVYFSILACTLIGFSLRNRCTGGRTILAGLSGCTLFFLVTNLAVWATFDTYPRTLDGLLQCYAAAIPFYRNSLIATGIFGAALFSPVCLRKEQPNLQSAAIEQAG